MIRRLFLALAFARPARSTVPVVTDIDTLNEFASHYNRYIEKLRDGVVDLKLWDAFVAGWSKLTR